ncbi:MAG: hypothetical protein K0S32_4036 [Bacteroidetes bacterium]|jgi:hypothetical protein|nr:hypothetical protein [Bacteroidota bacterium]
MSIEIRLLEESEYRLANDFYNKARNVNRRAPVRPRSYSEFCWEFMDCPNGKAIYAGAWENENGKAPVLVGMLCMILLKMISENGRQILTAKGEATLIDIRASMKHKQKDILKELFDVLVQECKNKGVQFIWGFNDIPATYQRLGCENAFKSNHGVLVLNPLKAYRNISSLKPTNTGADNFKLAVHTGVSYILSKKKIFILSDTNSHVFTQELNGNSDLFQNACAVDKLYFLLQDKNYLNWKISANPHNINYRSFQLMEENKSLVAQVICSVQKDVAFIEQTLFDKKITKNGRLTFLKKILQLLKKEDISLVRYTGFNNNKLNASEMNLLKSLGFVFTGKGEWFTFKNLSSDSPVNPENIYLSRMYKQGVN